MNKLFKLLLILFVLFRLITYENSLPEGKKILLSGQVSREVSVYDYNQKIIVHNHKIYLDKYPRIYYGDKVTIKGIVENGELKNAELVEKVDAKNIFDFRKKLIHNIGLSLPTRDAALVTGILLGSKKYLTEQFSTELIDSGTIHVVVASGTNVTITASFLISVLIIFIKRKYAIPIAIWGIWVYVSLSGWDPPLVRAAIMGSIAFSAQAFGRINTALNALFYSVLLMLIINPIWISDVGFQLSVVATLSLILFESHLNSKLHFVPAIIRQDLSTSLSAQIGVAPLLLYYFGRINLISPLVNMLVLWTVAPIMLLGSIASIIMIVNFQIGEIVFKSVLPFTKSFIFIIKLFV